jgi:hypothetical protein
MRGEVQDENAEVQKVRGVHSSKLAPQAPHVSWAAQSSERLCLDLAYALAGYTINLAQLLQRKLIAADAEAAANNVLLFWVKEFQVLLHQLLCLLGDENVFDGFASSVWEVFDRLRQPSVDR